MKHLSDKNIRVDSLENLKAEANDVADLIEEFQASNLKEVGCGYLIDTPDAVAHLVDSLLDLPRNPPSL